MCTGEGNGVSVAVVLIFARFQHVDTATDVGSCLTGTDLSRPEPGAVVEPFCRSKRWCCGRSGHAAVVAVAIDPMDG